MQSKQADRTMESGIRREEDRLFVYGAITCDNVVAVTRTGAAAIRSGARVVDLVDVIQVDSSAVSMLLEWVRTMQLHDRQVEFINLPANLAGLVELYDVSHLIPSGCAGRPG